MSCKIGILVSSETCSGGLLSYSDIGRNRLQYLLRYIGRENFISGDYVCLEHLDRLSKDVRRLICADPCNTHAGKVVGKFVDLATFKTLPAGLGAPHYHLGVSFCKNCISHARNEVAQATGEKGESKGGGELERISQLRPLVSTGQLLLLDERDVGGNVGGDVEEEEVEEVGEDESWEGAGKLTTGVFSVSNLETMNKIRNLLGLVEVKYGRLNGWQRQRVVRKSAEEIRNKILEMHDVLLVESSVSELDKVIDTVKPKLVDASSTRIAQSLSLFGGALSVPKLVNAFSVKRRAAENAVKLAKIPEILPEPPKKKGKCLGTDVVDKVRSFYLDDEYSKVSPKMKGVVQVSNSDGSVSNESRRFMLFTISEPHSKFLDKNQDIKIGQSSFATLRPSFCQVLSTKHHEVCCCVYCQNLELLFDGIKVKDFQRFLDSLVCKSQSKSCMFRRCKDCIDISGKFISLVSTYISEHLPSLVDNGITFKQWTHVDRDIIVSSHLACNDYCLHLAKTSIDTLRHYFTNRQQFSYFRDLKARLEIGVAVVQCDFAENYSTFYDKEIQKVFFDKEQVTIHPFVIHINALGSIRTVSAAVISDHMTHNTNAFFVFQKVILTWLKSEFSALKEVHYFTDVAASQYKNFKHFTNILHHQKDFLGISASHNFFASCHGKSACDGIGAVLKLMVRRACVGGTTIQTPREFFTFVSNKVKNVKCFFVSTEEVADVVNEYGLEGRYNSSKKIPHIRQVHRVTVGENATFLNTFELSSDPQPCRTIKLHEDSHVFDILDFEIGDWVAAVYEFDENFYYGQIVGIHLDEEDFSVRFFKDPGTFRVFSSKEKSPTFVPFNKIIRKVPAPTMRSRKFSFPEEIRASVLEKFNSMK